MQKNIAGWLVAILMLGCGTSNKKQLLNKEILGSWLILYPKEQLHTEAQRNVFPPLQDSLVNALGLKIIYFDTNNSITELDSIYAKRKGIWEVMNDSILLIKNTEKNLTNLNTKWVSLQNDTLVLRERIKFKGEAIVIDWYLKKINDSFVNAKLNSWRIKPNASESEKDIIRRIRDMLLFAAKYYQLLSVESIYFMPDRVPLPLKYYAGGIGLNNTLNKNFGYYFFDEKDAKKAYALFTKIFNESDIKFPDGNNYVEEYSKFLFQLAGAFEKRL